MGTVLWTKFSGDNWEVGRKLGQWWGELLRKTGGFPGGYKGLLRDSWDKEFQPLFDHTKRWFPGLFQEICGISQGASDAGFCTSINDVFGLVLAETGGCSSLVVRLHEGGFLIGHNEEEALKYPLCYARVKIDGVPEFASISYPFQLFGSSAGMTRRFAFQGNSIGSHGKKGELKNLWKYEERCVPKTVLTRMMLEQSTLAGLKNLFTKHCSTLPNHNYVCFPGSAHSIEIRPGEEPRFLRLTRKVNFHTNHFIRGGEIDSGWVWDGEGQAESVKRLKRLEGLWVGSDKVATGVATLLKGSRKELGGVKYTLATLCFKVAGKALSCEGYYYFGNEVSPIPPLKLDPT